MRFNFLSKKIESVFHALCYATIKPKHIQNKIDKFFLFKFIIKISIS